MALRRPYLFAGLLIFMQLGVGVAFGVLVTAANLDMFAYWGATSSTLAAILVLLLWRLRWFGRIGLRRSLRPRADLLLWVPLCPILAWNLSQIDLAALVPPERMAWLLLLTLLAAFVEEAIYRGLMLRALEPRGIWRAAIVTSLLFGAMHLIDAFAGPDPGVALGRVAYATAIGFAYAAYALRTGMIWPIILVHALANFAELMDQEAIFVESAPTEADLIRWLVYIALFTLYGVLVLRGTDQPAAGRSATPRSPGPTARPSA